MAKYHLGTCEFCSRNDCGVMSYGFGISPVLVDAVTSFPTPNPDFFTVETCATCYTELTKRRNYFIQANGITPKPHFMIQLMRAVRANKPLTTYRKRGENVTEDRPEAKYCSECCNRLSVTAFGVLSDCKNPACSLALLQAVDQQKPVVEVPVTDKKVLDAWVGMLSPEEKAAILKANRAEIVNVDEETDADYDN